MTKPKREPRIVRLTEIERILTALAGRGVEPAAYDLLPGGISSTRSETSCGSRLKRVESGIGNG